MPYIDFKRAHLLCKQSRGSNTRLLRRRCPAQLGPLLRIMHVDAHTGHPHTRHKLAEYFESNERNEIPSV